MNENKPERTAVCGIGRMASVLLVSLLACLHSAKADALALTSYFEAVLVRDVSTSWTTVSLDNNYVDAIPVCTYVLGTFAGSAGSYTDPPAVPRIRNIGSSSFELRIQGWEDSAASTSNVHCLVMESGAHTLPDGRSVEAHSVLSDMTIGQSAIGGSNWNQSALENVSADIVHSYATPVVLGQVISYNDNRASVINVSDCDARQNYPFQSGMSDGICVGKHIGQITGSRNSETIGYIVAEAGSGTVNDVFYEVNRGPDSIAGNNALNTGDAYSLNEHHTVAVLTQAGEDGGNGSWATLYGDTPLSDGTMQLAVDEQTFEGDSSRNHTNEIVYYWAFAGAELTLTKTVSNDGAGTAVASDFALSYAGASASGSGASGDDAVTTVVVPAGSYVLSESDLPGYRLSAVVCDGSDTDATDGLDINFGENVTCTFTNDDQSVDLTLVKTANDLSPNVGDTLTFTLDVSNTGPDLATDVRITDALPAGFSYVVASISGGDTRDDSSPAAPGLGWTINSLASGASVSLQFEATVLSP